MDLYVQQYHSGRCVPRNSVNVLDVNSHIGPRTLSMSRNVISSALRRAPAAPRMLFSYNFVWRNVRHTPFRSFPPFRETSDGKGRALDKQFSAARSPLYQRTPCLDAFRARERLNCLATVGCRTQGKSTWRCLEEG